MLLRLASQKEFELSKIHLKNIFSHCLRILNFLLARDPAFRTHRLLLRRFADRHYGSKFLQFLKEGALEVVASTDSHHFYEQINAALESMRLCADEPAVRLFEESFLTLTLLCRHEPFTDYLRAQQSQFADIDFLDKIYNTLAFLFASKDVTPAPCSSPHTSPPPASAPPSIFSTSSPPCSPAATQRTRASSSTTSSGTSCTRC